ncbi:hypothetical protein J6590_097011, partial [Homalodisca vitripennis]
DQSSHKTATAGRLTPLINRRDEFDCHSINYSPPFNSLSLTIKQGLLSFLSSSVNIC